MDSERIRDLERRVAYLVERACAVAHDYPERFNILCGSDGADFYLRYCRCCGKADRRTLEQGNGLLPRNIKVKE